jgi:four helix bundle protein
VGKITTFEDIEAWKEARSLANRVYDFSAEGLFAKDFGLRDQMRRAAVSILSNIAEGFERGGDKEFLQFLALAKGSAGELRSQLYLALDRNYLTQQQFADCYEQVVRISRLLGGFMLYLRQSGMRGNKYNDLGP